MLSIVSLFKRSKMPALAGSPNFSALRPMIDFTTAIKQGRLTRMGYSSLCGIRCAVPVRTSGALHPPPQCSPLLPQNKKRLRHTRLSLANYEHHAARFPSPRSSCVLQNSVRSVASPHEHSVL